jgi:hypothetical protein
MEAVLIDGWGLQCISCGFVGGFVIHSWLPDCAVMTPVLYNAHSVFESSSVP